MNTSLPSPQRKVTLRLAGGDASKPASLSAAELEALLERARAAGLPMHHDAQIAALLTSLRLREDVPATLYAAAAALLSSIYEAAQ